jgi:hypothetical protein
MENPRKRLALPGRAAKIFSFTTVVKDKLREIDREDGITGQR